MTNEKDLTTIKFKALQITDEEEKSLILEREKFDKIVCILDILPATRTNQHKRLLRQHCFTLLFSSITYGENIVAKLAHPELIDTIDEKFGTPLIYALSLRQFGIAESLLEYTDDYINWVVRGNTALSYAALYSQTELERKIMEKGGIIPGMEFSPAKTPSEVRDGLIRTFMHNALLYGGIEISSPLLKFLRFCRADCKELRSPFAFIDSLCAADKSFHMLMRLTTYAHETRNTHMFFANMKHRAILNLGRDRTAAFVDYVSNNVFVFYDTIVSLQNMVSLVHECAHLVINLVYDNYYRPYSTSEDEAKFTEIVQLTEERLREFIEYNQHNEPPECIQTLSAVLDSVYKDYAIRQWPEELIVRVPELLATLGVQQGQSLLREIFPELLDFYYQKVVPKMYDFITSHLLKIDLAGSRDCFIKLYRQMQEMICNNALDKEFLPLFDENMAQLSLEELSHLIAILSFMDYKALTIILNDHYVEKEKQQQRQQRINTNLSILNELRLNPYPGIQAVSNCPAYWAQFVEHGGGVLYAGHPMPHRISRVFQAIKKLTPNESPETTAPDCEPAILLETIREASESSSQSWASFFGLKNPAIERLKQQVIQMKGHYQVHSY